MLKYFIVFDAVVYGIFLFQLFQHWCKGMQVISVCWFFLSCKFIEVTCSNTLIFWTLRFSIFEIIPANSDNFISSFPIFGCLIYLSCLNDLVRTSSTVLNRSDESGHPFLVLDLKGKAFSFSSLSIKLALGLLCMAFIMLGMFLLYPIL